MADERHIKHGYELLRQIAEFLDKPRVGLVRMTSIEVEFTGPDADPGYKFTLPQALDAIARDTYWDERGDWSLATIAFVRVI